MTFLSKLFSITPKPLSKDDFAGLVLRRLRESGEERNVDYDKSEFRLVTDADKRTMFLGNLYSEYLAAEGPTREQLLQRAIRAWFVVETVVPEECEDARHDLMPVIRARSYFDSATLLARLNDHEEATVPYQPLADDLAISLVYDLPESMRSISQDDLDKWGITFYEAMEAARDNFDGVPFQFMGPAEGEGVYVSATNDSYDATRLLLIKGEHRFKVKGDLIAMVPNRDVLILAGAEDESGLKAMAELANETLQKPRPMSGFALKLEGDDWVTWMPPKNHPLYSEFHLLQLQSRGSDYAEQKQLLEKVHETTGEELFVATYFITQDNNTGEYSTHCVWTENVSTLLPHTTKIAFLRQGEEQKATLVPWDKAVGVIGDLMQPTGTYPERWQVSEFPTEEQLAEMEA